MKLWDTKRQEGIMKMRMLAFAAAGLLCAGCGQMYWTKADATLDTFLADHDPCFNHATIGYGVGSENAYKACMRSHGWSRIQESSVNERDANGAVITVHPHFRGPEDDDSFRDSDQARYRNQGQGPGAKLGGS
jgi:hypothetical protein